MPFQPDEDKIGSAGVKNAAMQPQAAAATPLTTLNRSASPTSGGMAGRLGSMTEQPSGPPRVGGAASAKPAASEVAHAGPTGWQQANPYAGLVGKQKVGAMASGQPNAAEAAKPGANGWQQATGAMADSGPSATGFVNFDRLYNANAGVAQREASRRAGAARGKAQNAYDELLDLQRKTYGQIDAGSLKAPSEFDWAKASGTYHSPNSLQTKTGGADPLWREQIGKNADASYTGPSGLDANAYADLLGNTTAATDELNALPNEGLKGNSIDQDLLGAAGRPDFERAQDDFKNLKTQTEYALPAAQGRASDAASQTEANRKQWEDLAGAYDKTHAPPPPGPDTSIHVGAAPGVGDESTEIGWGSADQQAFAMDKLNANKSLDEVRGERRGGQYGGDDNPTASIWAKQFGVSQQQAETILAGLTDEQWAGWQRAVSRGEEAMRQWWASVSGGKA